MKWFKHYNEASEGSLIGDLISTKEYEAALLWWVLLEFVSRFEKPENRGECTFPLARIARVMNMKQPRTAMLLGRIRSASGSDCDCNVTPFPPRMVTVKVHNWAKLQENRGGKRDSKNTQSPGEVRSKKEDVRSKNIETEEKPVFDFELAYSLYPNKTNKSEGLHRLKAQIDGPKDFEDFLLSISNYVRYLDLEKNKNWLKAKQWDVFIGAPSKPNKPWRDWINPDSSLFIDDIKMSGKKVTRANLEESA